MDIQKTAAYIASKRKAKNLTQRQLAEKLNISDKTVSKWETAKGLPDVAIIRDLCTALDISPTEFFSGEDIPAGDSAARGDIIIDVARQYHTRGRKESICIYTYALAVLLCIVCSFFGDGFAKIAVTVSCYLAGGIAAYKLAATNHTRRKKLQKAAIAALIITLVMTADLGFNYLNRLNVMENDGIAITGIFARLLIGDYNWTLHRFLMVFKNSVSARALTGGLNCYLWSAIMKNR